MPVVYLITNRINGKHYVGITKHTIESRFRDHICNSKNPKLDRNLYRAMRKYGTDNFEVSLLEECHDDAIYEAEQKWIAIYNSNNFEHGYNMTAGGEGCVDREYSPDTLQKMSDSLKLQRASMTFEERKALTIPANNAKLGRKESEASRKLKSAAQTKRFSNMSDDELRKHGQRSHEGISAEGRLRQIRGWNEAFSPVREKGFKQSLTNCPHCGKNGGAFAMKRYHFDRCKLRSDSN